MEIKRQTKKTGILQFGGRMVIPNNLLAWLIGILIVVYIVIKYIDRKPR